MYSNEDLSALKRQIEECNSNMEAQLSAQKAKIDGLTLKYQQILGAKDIEKLQEHLKALEKSRDESLQTLNNNLLKCKRTGIFIGVLREINPYSDINDFIKATQAAMIPLAIEDIIGVSLKRITTVIDLQTVKDVVVSYKGGKVQPGLELYKKSLYANRQFLYVLKEEVYPTKDIPKINDARRNFPSNTVIFNALTEDYATELSKLGVPKEEIAQVKTKIDIHKDVIDTENQNADMQQQSFANASMDEVRKIERDIEDKKAEINRKKQQLRTILNSISGATYDEYDPAKSVKNAQNLLKTQLQNFQKEWFAIKEKELAYRETSVQIDGSPQEAIAKKTQELFTQIQKNYTEFTVSRELIIVEDGAIQTANSDSKVQRYRRVKQVWVYPSPQNDGTFKVGVVTVFEMKEGGGSGGDNGGESREDFTETVNGVSFVMKAIPAGTFMMGSNEYSDTKPIHSVTLDAFYIGETEVTQALWQAVMGNNPSYFKGNNLSVEKVSWGDTQDFIRKLNSLTGKKYTLPSEAQWEYAAKANQSYKYAGSDNIDEVAWYNGNSGSATDNVKGKKANAFGLYDMSGNVCEWCQDIYANYSSGSQINPIYQGSGSRRVSRGGGWGNYATFCASAYRNSYSTSNSYFDLGFRLVRTE